METAQQTPKTEPQQKTTKSKKTLTTYAESGTFTRQDGTKVDYTSYYVEIMGIKVKIEAKDNTGKQLLEVYFNE